MDVQIPVTEAGLTGSCLGALVWKQQNIRNGMEQKLRGAESLINLKCNFTLNPPGKTSL